MHTTIYSISESPKNGRVIWVGTDDGNVQLTQDGGATWRNRVGNIKGLPKASWVSWVEAGRFDAATAYAAFDRHTFGDLTPYVYKTADAGETWIRIAGPEQGLRGWAHVIKEDAIKPDLLFIGTEFGLWVSPDGGKAWAEFKGGNFPSVAVRDIMVHPRTNDLVLATHGRGIWIVDDISPLRGLSEEVLQKEAAFLEARPTVQRIEGQGGYVEGDATFFGPNPPGGAVITYCQRTRHLFGPIKIEILGPDGKLVNTIPAGKRRGINRVSWSMRVAPPRVPKAASVAGSSLQGPRVLPGAYVVRLTKGRDVYETKLEIGLDPRADFTAADRKAQFEAAMRVHGMFNAMSTLVDKITLVRARADQAAAPLPAKEALRRQLEAVSTEADGFRKKIVATKEGGAITGEERLRERMDALYGTILSYEGRPAQYQLENIDALQREMDDVSREFDAYTAKTLPKINEGLKAKGLRPIGG